MAAPTTAFKKFARTKATTDLDTRAERIGATTGWGSGDFSTVDASANPLDFGTVDISGGAANSLVFYLGWKVTANGGNTLVDNFRIWCESASNFGFDQAGTKLFLASLKFEAGGTYGSLYQANAITSTYNNATYGFAGTNSGVNGIEATGAPAQNIYAGDGTNSINITTVDSTDDIVAAALYLGVATGETTGTYQGLTSGREFRGSFRYDYS